MMKMEMKINLNVITFFDMVNTETEEKSEYVIVQEQGYEDENPIALKVIKMKKIMIYLN